MLRLDSASLLSMIDASYDTSLDAARWTSRLLTAVMKLDSSKEGGAFRFSSSYADGRFNLTSTTLDAYVGEARLGASALAATGRQPAPLLERMLGRTLGGTLSELTGLGADAARNPDWRDVWSEPIVDVLGITVRDADGEGVAVSVGLDRVVSTPPREKRLLAMLATHVGAGYRLLRDKRPSSLDAAEAVLTPNGTLLHATEPAAKKRHALDDGRLRRDEARKTTHDAEKALEIWQGLVAGRWSLVDHFDTDGKRFLLAMKNTPRVDRRADLTPRERRVAALAAMGHSDKEIAYALGLSMPSVTSAVHRARTKLGAKSRGELAAIWRTAG